MSETIIRTIWAVFFAYWFYSATKIKKARSSEPTWTRILHLTAMVTNWVLLLAGEWLPEFSKRHPGSGHCFRGALFCHLVAEDIGIKLEWRGHS